MSPSCKLTRETRCEIEALLTFLRLSQWVQSAGITAKMSRLDVITPLMTACAIGYFYDLYFNLMPVESSLPVWCCWSL